MNSKLRRILIKVLAAEVTDLSKFRKKKASQPEVKKDYRKPKTDYTKKEGLSPEQQKRNREELRKQQNEQTRRSYRVGRGGGGGGGDYSPSPRHEPEPKKDISQGKPAIQKMMIEELEAAWEEVEDQYDLYGDDVTESGEGKYPEYEVSGIRTATDGDPPPNELKDYFETQVEEAHKYALQVIWDVHQEELEEAGVKKEDIHYNVLEDAGLSGDDYYEIKDMYFQDIGAIQFTLSINVQDDDMVSVSSSVWLNNHGDDFYKKVNFKSILDLKPKLQRALKEAVKVIT